VLTACRDGDNALDAIRDYAPDVALLEVELAGRGGFEVAAALSGPERPAFIFTTADGAHALPAFDAGAADFLLKPFSPVRLARALTRARALSPRDGDAVAAAANGAPLTPLNRLVVRVNDRMIVVAADAIDWIESAGNYAVLHADRGNHVLRETLSELEARLAAGRFLRVSRTAVVNLDRVRELRVLPDGSREMMLTDGSRLPITRGIREVQARLEAR
jgi:two-component system, LytTR family, response regulator